MLYEILYIIPAPYTEKDFPNIKKSVNQIIEELGAKIIHEGSLGNRKLAYPIKKVRRGFYVFVHFETQPDKIKKIEEKLKLMPEVLRFQIVKISTKKIKKSEEKSTEKPTEKLDLKTLGEKIDKLLEI